jgi:murein DD-endopeptidase MepM/ murein hydrolase activator NlpD
VAAPWRRAGNEADPLTRPLLLCLVALGAALAGCGDTEVIFEDTPGATATATRGTPDAGGEPELHGFAYPLAGGCLPQSDLLMPNAARAYRGGTHEGVDFYDSDNCTTIAAGTPVLAAKAGVVARADVTYHELTAEELAEADRRIDAGEADAFEVVDLFRGRQVWIDHGNGVMTRYAHLSGVAPDLEEGDRVEQGQVVGYVGDSGTPESLSNPGQETHLHWEVRVGETYLGAGEEPVQVRALYRSLFEAAP